MTTHFLRDDSGKISPYRPKIYVHVLWYFNNCEHVRFHPYHILLIFFFSWHTQNKKKVLRSFFCAILSNILIILSIRIFSLIVFGYVSSSYIHNMRNKFVGRKILRSFFSRKFQKYFNYFGHPQFQPYQPRICFFQLAYKK